MSRSESFILFFLDYFHEQFADAPLVRRLHRQAQAAERGPTRPAAGTT